ncbi:Retrovirus-related Pol polyprotein from transposon RE1 [Vitis vinifera]|uniref:Retrovirus-related Pol polyprotein from transposon RE1 n=1 Tax=Vitis vinifera TaxID=29760 RepID=A0A438D6H1_VITVI|nr:Retrovirus-related Pol polyprotein from transposon RE1 [Vitis vinifera]
MVETYVCLGKASSSSPVTFLLCLGPDIPVYGQGYENHLVTPEDVIPDVDKTDKFFMVLTLIGLHPDLESVRNQILASPSVPSLDDPLKLTLKEDVVAIGVEDNVLSAPIVISLVTLEIVAISYMDGPPRTATLFSHLILCYLDLTPLRAPHLRVSPLLVVIMMPISDIKQSHQLLLLLLPRPVMSSVCFTQSPSLGPWILDSGASDHISNNKHIFSSITNYLYLTYYQSTRKTIGIGRESQGLYHLTSPSSLAACSSIDTPLLIHNRLGHPSLSKFQKMVPRFSTLSSLACESCQLGKHTRVSFPKRLNIDDNAREYFSTPFTYFMSQHGILHQSSYAHTPQQNEDKLSAKATKCLFLGYSRLQKGYCCYSPDTHRIFSPLMSPSLRTLHSSHPLNLFPFMKYCHFPVYPPLQMRSLVLFRFIIVDIVLLLLLSLQLSYHRLCSSYSAFVSTLSSVSLPKSTNEALCHPGWQQAMVDELTALHSNGTWDLVSLPPSKSTIGCRWVYTVKVVLMVRLLLFVYFSPWQLCVIGLFISWILRMFSFMVNFSRKVYMEQPPGFVAQGESGLVCKLRRSLYGLKQSPRAWFGRFSSIVQEFGMLRSEANHSVFYHHNSSSQCIYLVVYVDDIVITGGALRDPGRYRRLVGKLNYLTITRPDISFPVSVVSQFLQSPCDNHWDVVIRILRYIKGTPGQGMLYEDKGHTPIVGYTDAD